MDPQITADGSGGAIISWRDARSGTYHIYAQRIDANGTVQWAPNGVAITSERYGQYGPDIVPDGKGNFYIAWRDDRSGVGQIYCQKLDGNGNAQWATNGIAVCPTSYWQDIPETVVDGSGGVILVWVDERNSIINSFVYAQRLDGSGNKLWTASGVPVDLSTGLKGRLSCIEDGYGGAYIAWDSGNAAEWQDIFAQRIDSAGVILPTGTVPVCTAPQEQEGPSLVLDGSGGAIIAWEWGWGTPSYFDIFAQRVDPDGNLLWPETGVVVCGAVDGQYYPQMIPNGEGGAILTWRDMRQDTIGAVYAMRVTANGETVATLLQSFAAWAQGRSIVLEWRLAEMDADARFTVLRSSGGDYEELIHPSLQRDGLSFTCSDETCRPGVAYRYRVDIETGGERRILFESEAVSLPSLELALMQNYPNPFNPVTTIRFDLPVKERVRLAVYDCAGREVVCLLDGEREPGSNEVSWDGRDSRGAATGTGIYFYRLTAGKRSLTKKMVLLN